MLSEELMIIDDPALIPDVMNYLDDFEFVAFDTETTGLDEECEIVGMSFAAEECLGIYVIISRWDPVERKLVRNAEMREAVKPLLAKTKTKQLIMHNALFDCKVVRREYRIDLMPSVHTDTMILAHLLDENNSVGLKELATRHFGVSAKKEQQEMKASVIERGGIWKDTKKGVKEMYKADPQILGKYGAKDAVLTLKLLNPLMTQLVEEGLDVFFYEEECMPLLRGPTYQMNDHGLKLNGAKLDQLEREMDHEVKRLKLEILDEIRPYIKDKPKFSITSPQKLSWLLFVKLGYSFRSLNDTGKEVARDLFEKVPYSPAEKRRFVAALLERQAAMQPEIDEAEKDLADKKAALKLDKTKTTDEKKTILKPYETRVKAARKAQNSIAPEKLIKADKQVLTDLAVKNGWIRKLLKMKSESKLLGTYVRGIKKRMRYGVIQSNFNQIGTDGTRYSSSNPNFQNLPRDDKRIKSCIEARPGKSFVGADQSQLEPRVFASVSQDPALMECFASGKDFYSVVGIPVFRRFDTSPFKKDPKAFAELYPIERQIAKNSCLAAAYGTTAHRLSDMLRDEEGNNLTVEHCQQIIDDYFEAYPAVKKMMLQSHRMAKKQGYVTNLFGRRRRIPEAIRIGRMYPNTPHAELPYEARTILNLAMNFRVQGTAGSIMNRAAIRFVERCAERAKTDARWLDVILVLQVHDELVAEAPDAIVHEVAAELKDAMENTVTLPGVKLVAEPKIGKLLSDLK